jgi:hypothetical protein
MTLLTSNQLVKMKTIFNEIDANNSIPTKQGLSTKKRLLVSELKCSFEIVIKRFLDLLHDRILFEAEYERSINRALKEKAITEEHKTYKGLTPCSSTKRTGSACGNLVRYVSNGGCAICQCSDTHKKDTRELIVKEIIGSFQCHKKKSPIVKMILDKTDIKRATAYRLVDKFINDKSIYKIVEKQNYIKPELPDIAGLVKSTASKQLFGGLVQAKDISNSHNTDEYDYDLNQDETSNIDSFINFEEDEQNLMDELYQESYDEIGFG